MMAEEHKITLNLTIPGDQEASKGTLKVAADTLKQSEDIIKL
jgi:hypothetical protein